MQVHTLTHTHTHMHTHTHTYIGSHIHINIHAINTESLVKKYKNNNITAVMNGVLNELFNHEFFVSVNRTE